MTDVWRMPAIGRWEKTCGKHPTQKPLRLLVRMILASTDEGDWILGPFSGSATTGIAANLCGRRFAGSNRIAADDNPALLLSIALRPLAQPPFPLSSLSGVDLSREMRHNEGNDRQEADA